MEGGDLGVKEMANDLQSVNYKKQDSITCKIPE